MLWFTRKTYEDKGGDESQDSRATKVPDKMRIDNHGRTRQVDDVGNGGVEQVDSGHQSSHVNRRTGIGNAIGGYVDEKLGEATNGVWETHPPDRNGGSQTVVNTLGIGGPVVAAG